jgi:hypothetical protein
VAKTTLVEPRLIALFVADEVPAETVSLPLRLNEVFPVAFNAVALPLPPLVADTPIALALRAWPTTPALPGALPLPVTPLPLLLEPTTPSPLPLAPSTPEPLPKFVPKTAMLLLETWPSTPMSLPLEPKTPTPPPLEPSTPLRTGGDRSVAQILNALPTLDERSGDIHHPSRQSRQARERGASK